jgi:hypothetical protein
VEPREQVRAKAVLSEVLRVPSGDRIRLIQEAFPNDPKAWDELLEILDGYSKASEANSGWTGGTTFGNLIPEFASSSVGSSTAVLAVGASFGPYRVVRMLTPGGMGEVAIADDVRLPRRVALKCLAGRWLASPLARQRLLREARTAAALNHPNIATLYDVLDDVEHPVLVMEYVEGRSLHEILAEGPVPLGLALRYAIQLSEAVGYAHDHGIIHCDIKPANIQITPEGIAKVLDFGLARAQFEQADELSLSERGKVLGTPGYMAPERLTRGTLNASGDIYALGVVLFELVTGSDPYADRGHALMLAVLASDAPAPSSLVPELPRAVDAILGRALARNPVLRYRSGQFGIDPLSGAASRTWHWRQLVALWIPAIVLLLTVAGFATLILYNSPLGLTGSFQPESPLVWPMRGVGALLPPAFTAAVIAVLVVLASFVARLAAMGLLGSWAVRAATWFRHLAASIRSQPTTVLAPAVLILQLATIGLSFWRFQPLFEGVDNFITRRPPTNLAALRPQNRPEHNLMTQVFSVQVVVFGVAWYWLRTHRRRRHEREGSSVIVAGFAVTAFSLLAGQIFPRHILYHNKSERVAYRAQRCYLVGQSGSDAMLFCPHQPPPWNQIVKLDDPSLKREGVVESIFSGF